jgi:hypothetical protein
MNAKQAKGRREGPNPKKEIPNKAQLSIGYGKWELTVR